MENETSNNPQPANGIISDVISRKFAVYFVGLRNKQIIPAYRKIFTDNEVALKYWEEMGKEEYTYWREYVYGL